MEDRFGGEVTILLRDQREATDPVPRVPCRLETLGIRAKNSISVIEITLAPGVPLNRDPNLHQQVCQMCSTGWKRTLAPWSLRP